MSRTQDFSHGAIHGTIRGIIPAGGVGSRAHVVNHDTVNHDTPDKNHSRAGRQPQVTDRPIPKQYRLINGSPMLVHAVAALLADARVQDVVVGVQANDTEAHVHLEGLARVQVSPSAGSTRALTVLQTLRQSQFADEDWVLVHDAARPGLPLDRLTALIDRCLAHDQGGLLAMPAADTVKLAQPGTDAVARVQCTLARDTIWLAQTPQMFRAGELKQALTDAIDAGVDVTDEASAMEWAGHTPLLVPGSSRNLKVTWPEDFEAVEGLQ